MHNSRKKLGAKLKGIYRRPDLDHALASMEYSRYCEMFQKSMWSAPSRAQNFFVGLSRRFQSIAVNTSNATKAIPSQNDY